LRLLVTQPHAAFWLPSLPRPLPPLAKCPALGLALPARGKDHRLAIHDRRMNVADGARHVMIRPDAFVVNLRLVQFVYYSHVFPPEPLS